MISPLWERFESVSLKQQDKVAITIANMSIRYGELMNQAVALGNALVAAGCKSGKRAGLYIGTSIDYCVAVLAILWSGATLVPLSTHYRNEELIQYIDHCGIDAMIVGPSTLTKWRKEIDDWSCRVFVYDRSCFQYSAHENCEAQECGEDAVFLMTSGSTSDPKIAMISQAAMLARVEAEESSFGLSCNERVLISTPLYHSLGLRILISSLCIGASIKLLEGFTAKSWISAIAENEITYTISVPSQLASVVKYDMPQIRDSLKSLRFLASTAAYLDPSVREDFAKLYNGRFVNFIASSETEFIAWNDCRKPDLKGDELGVPFSGVEIRINKANVNDTVGEIICKSNQLLHGYYGSELLTDQSFIGNFFRTGDIGYFDDMGILHYSGRKKRVIVTSGVNIFPSDIETAVSKLELGVKCRVIGKPSLTFGEVAVLVVESDHLNASEIKRYCLDALPVYQQPHEILVVPKLPYNELGKIKDGELIKLISSQCDDVNED